MILTNEQVQRLYQRIAPLYDIAVVPFRWLGLSRHRKQAVRSLQLRRGDAVLDLGCGTGLNIPLLHNAVGSSGQIIGVDLSLAMLSQARNRVVRHGFTNVVLAQADLATFKVPSTIAGAVATFALEMIPEYDDVVRRVAAEFPVGGRLAVYGLKHPERWPSWLTTIGVWLTRPFGVSRAYESFRPWEAVRRHLHEVEYNEFLMGAAYLSVGERRDKASAA